MILGFIGWVAGPQEGACSTDQFGRQPAAKLGWGVCHKHAIVCLGRVAWGPGPWWGLSFKPLQRLICPHGRLQAVFSKCLGHTPQEIFSWVKPWGVCQPTFGFRCTPQIWCGRILQGLHLKKLPKTAWAQEGYKVQLWCVVTWTYR